MGHLTVKTGSIAGNLTKIFQKSQMPGGLPGGGGMGGFGIDRYIRKVRKRCSHSRFSFQATILGVFYRSVGLCCSCFPVANGRRNYLSQAMTRGEKGF